MDHSANTGADSHLPSQQTSFFSYISLEKQCIIMWPYCGPV